MNNGLFSYEKIDAVNAAGPGQIGQIIPPSGCDPKPLSPDTPL